eukprot:TRINITY_DN111939_c0_g1_i1.p1 TRINITY_DN111939_c0_g1~~TRINITY_DN111939_c0_g1_i1.p1  ORF type:complete len:473 (-),score=116.84 TRINITY_DN111939_c0_g1_i1:112-1530(-)
MKHRRRKTAEVVDDDVKVVDLEEEKIEAKDEDEDERALRELERQRAEILADVATDFIDKDEKPLESALFGARKRKRDDPEEEWAPKRRRKQPAAVLIDTGRTKQTVTSTTLMNVRQMLFLSNHMPWLEGPQMIMQRQACSAALLDAYHVLVLGGNAGPSTTSTTEVLDLRRMCFVPGPRMRSHRSGCAAVMLDANRLLVVGGYDGNDYLDTTEVLNLATNEFWPGPRMHHRRAAPAIVRLESGHIVVVGGKNGRGCLATTEVLDTKTPTWSFVVGPRMKRQRGGPTVATLDRSRLLVVGGHDDLRTHDTTEILHITDATVGSAGMNFTQGPMMTGAPRSYASAVMLSPTHVQIIGGHDGLDCIETTEVLNLTTMEFAIGPRMRSKRFMGTAVVVSEGCVLVAGGSDGAASHFTTEMLTLSTYNFVAGGKMPTALDLMAGVGGYSPAGPPSSSLVHGSPVLANGKVSQLDGTS